MKKKLRIISLAMLIIAVVFVFFAFMSMDSTITLPLPAKVLRIIYQVYVLVMAGIFILSFFVRDKAKREK